MNNNNFFLKNLNLFIFAISFFLSLLIYFSNLYRKDIYIFNFDNLKFRNISEKFLDENFFKKIKFEQNSENEDFLKKYFTSNISKFLAEFYLFTNTLSNNVRYDPNDLDIFEKNYRAIDYRTIDFIKKKNFIKVYEDNFLTSYNNLEFNNKNEFFKKKNNFYLKYFNNYFYLFTNKNEFNDVKNQIEFSKNFLIYSYKNYYNLKKDPTVNVNIFYKESDKIILNIYENLAEDKIFFKKISKLYTMTTHFAVLVFITLIFFLILKFIFFISNFIKHRFYNHNIDSGFVN